MDELYEEIAPEAVTLTPLTTNVVLRRAAEIAVEREDEEQTRILAYLRLYCSEPRLEVALQNIEAGAHRRRRSQSMEAVIENTGTYRMKGGVLVETTRKSG